MADGEIVFSTSLDNSKLQKELDRTIRDINSLEEKIAKLGAKKIPLEDKLRRIAGELDEAKAVLAGMRAAPKGTYEKADIADQAARVRLLQAEFTKTANSVDNIDGRLQAAEIDLDAAKEKAGALYDEMGRAEKGAQNFSEASKMAGKRVLDILKRLKSLAASALLFSAITAALIAMRKQIVAVVRSNADASAAIARLRGALLTLAAPIVQAIIPAFTALVRVIAAAAARLAQLAALLSGKGLSSMVASAKALNDQTKALKGTGKAAKDAGRSLASFDEINRISSGASAGGDAATDGIAPDFSFMDALDERTKKIADNVLLIGAGLAAWKLSKLLPGALGTIAGKLAGIAIAVGGLTLLWDGLKDAWENGVDWGNLIEIIGGAAAAALGLYVAYGEVGARIGLVVAVAAMVVTAFHDIIDNGVNLKNTLLLIAGIVATGLGFFVLTGNVIPLVIAGIASIVTAILAWTGNLGDFVAGIKQIFSGLAEFIGSAFTGDMDAAFNGLTNIVKGFANTVLSIVNAIIGVATKALNWIISKLNSISFDIPDWVPDVGGKTFGVNIPTIPDYKIPALAQGAVIPPNREFLAVLGDQRSGNNIETPLATMVQAFKQALAESGYGGSNQAVLVLDRDVLGRVVYQLNKAEGNRIGVSLTGV